MNKRQRNILTVLAILLIASLLVLGASAQAQPLNDTQWFESLSLDADQSLQGLGVDPLAPENQSGQLNGEGWSLDGSINFGPPGPPQVTTQVNGSYTGGLTYIGGSAYVMISFEFRLNMMTQPPVSINTVPLSVTAQGTADVSGDQEFFALAFAFLDLWTGSGPLVSLEARATIDPNDADPNSDSFNTTAPFSVGPNDVVSGSMTANAFIGAEVPQSAIAASAQAFIDPIIEVADQLIPGTSLSYRDVFEVQLAPGYMLEPTAVSEKTWSQVKSIYTDGKSR